jgi:hypothetical protein
LLKLIVFKAIFLNIVLRIGYLSSYIVSYTRVEANWSKSIGEENIGEESIANNLAIPIPPEVCILRWDGYTLDLSVVFGVTVIEDFFI